MDALTLTGDKLILIAFTGRARGGKSSAASAVLKEALAEGLKSEMFEISSYILEDAINRKQIEAKVREDLTKDEIKKLVELGQERRAEDPYYWLKMLEQDLTAKNPDVALVPNLRFLNEAELIRRLGGKITRVSALICDSVEFVSEDRNPNDVSEIEHYAIQADYFLTTKRGESDLLKMQAATLFKYLVRRGNA